MASAVFYYYNSRLAAVPYQLVKLSGSTDTIQGSSDSSIFILYTACVRIKMRSWMWQAI